MSQVELQRALKDAQFMHMQVSANNCNALFLDLARPLHALFAHVLETYIRNELHFVLTCIAQ